MDKNSEISKTFCLQAKWILANNFSVLKDTSIIIENQIITDILPNDITKNKYQNIPTKILNSHIVLPGFINTHCHSPMNLIKGYADDLPLMTWLNDYIWPIENKFFSDEFAYEGALLAMAEMLKNGITTVNDMYFYTDSIAKAADEIGIRANIGTHVFDPPSKWAKNTDEYLNHCQRLINNYQDHKLIGAVVTPHAPYTVSDSSFKKIIAFAEKNNIAIGCHIHETQDEIDHSLKEYNLRPIERLNKLGFFDQNVFAIHMTQLTQQEIKLMSKKNISIAHCPISNLKLASGFCPIKQLVDNNINIALGTDGAASNNNLDMLDEMKTASITAKATALDPTVLSATDTLKLATINGAKLMNLENKIGSLEIGKQADIIALDLNNLSSQPVYNPLSSIVYTATRDQISDVWVDGVQKVCDHNLIAIDNNLITSIIDKWQDKISCANKN